MKFLVFGSSGMAGHTISLYLKEKGHEVTGFDIKGTKHFNSIVGDVRNTGKVRELLVKNNYDSVINCVGILNQFAEQKKELAVYLNSYFPYFLANATIDTKTQIIHMSTDCVFSGKQGGYTEKSLKDGESFYDRSKALGEIDDNKNVTFRTSIIGPDINLNGIGLFNWFMKQNGPINGFTNAIWTGLTTLELAKAMESAAKEKAFGLYNMVYEEPISKYELLFLLNRYFRNSELAIIPSESMATNKSLVRTNFDFGYIIPEYEKMIADLSWWVEKHKGLYPHYNLQDSSNLTKMHSQ